MHVQVIYIGRIRSKAGQRSEVVEVQPGTTVLRMLEQLVAKYGDEFKKTVFDDNQLAPGLNVIIDGLNVTKHVMTRDEGSVARLPAQDAKNPEVELVLLDAPPSGG